MTTSGTSKETRGLDSGKHLREHELATGITTKYFHLPASKWVMSHAWKGSDIAHHSKYSIRDNNYTDSKSKSDRTDGATRLQYPSGLLQPLPPASPAHRVGGSYWHASRSLQEQKHSCAWKSFFRSFQNGSSKSTLTMTVPSLDHTT